jgi:cytochrome c
MKRFVLAAATGIVLASGMGAVHAGDVEAGKAKYATCQGCHGPTGQGQAIFPAVAGKDVDYLADVLKKYKAGEQVGPNSAMMMPHAINLSDDDIVTLAAYMGSL